MREYLEATETVDEGQVAEFIRSEVTDMTEQEKDDVQVAIEDVMSDKHYRLITHYCEHDQSKPCKTELIKEV